MTTLATFRSVRAVGTVLPAEALARAVDLGMPGQRTEDYQLTPGMTINGAAARAWEAALGAHRAWKTALERLPDGDPAMKLTRERWLLPLLYELGYGRPETLPAGIDLPPGLGETEPTRFPLSHRLTWPAGSPSRPWAFRCTWSAQVFHSTPTPTGSRPGHRSPCCRTCSTGPARTCGASCPTDTPCGSCATPPA